MEDKVNKLAEALTPNILDRTTTMIKTYESDLVTCLENALVRKFGPTQCVYQTDMANTKRSQKTTTEELSNT